MSGILFAFHGISNIRSKLRTIKDRDGRENQKLIQLFFTFSRFDESLNIFELILANPLMLRIKMKVLLISRVCKQQIIFSNFSKKIKRFRKQKLVIFLPQSVVLRGKSIYIVKSDAYILCEGEVRGKIGMELKLIFQKCLQPRSHQIFQKDRSN